MSFADVNCAHCKHKMSKHKVVNRENSVCQEPNCVCVLGPARRDDLLDEIDGLRNTLRIIKKFIIFLNPNLDTSKQEFINEKDKILNFINIKLGDEKILYESNTKQTIDIELTEERANVLKNNLNFAIDRLCDYYLLASGEFDHPEIGNEIDILNEIIQEINDNIDG